jgi:hypothetical protein
MIGDEAAARRAAAAETRGHFMMTGASKASPRTPIGAWPSYIGRVIQDQTDKIKRCKQSSHFVKAMILTSQEEMGKGKISDQNPRLLYVDPGGLKGSSKSVRSHDALVAERLRCFRR